MISRSFLVQDLEKLDELISVDDQGNMVRFQAFRIDPAVEARGFLRGTWEPIAEGESIGHWRGLWVSQSGQISGHVRGVYGLNGSGQPVLFGKFVDTTGRFRGILRGTWGTAGVGADGAEVGWFGAVWVTADNQERGSIRGRWRLAGEERGFFDGRWCVGCRWDRTAGEL
jgi:hypothetical protein